MILLSYKDKKYLTIDINGRTKVIEDTSKHKVVNIKSNIEEYNEYITKLRMLGVEIFNYEIKEETDEVIITEYIENKEDYRIIEIPSFVTGIKKDAGEDFEGIFKQVNQSLKVIHRYNQIKDMSWLFSGFSGKNIDLRDFDTSNVTNISSIFACCGNLAELNISSFNTSNVTDMNNMFYDCRTLKELDVRNFYTSKVKNMRNMFSWCKNLTSLDLSNFDTSKVTDMGHMFYNTSLTPENTNLKVKE